MNNTGKSTAAVVLVFFLLSLFLRAQDVTQLQLDSLEDEINGLLKDSGHGYIRIIITTDDSGAVQIRSYFLRDLGNLEYPSKMTMVATLVGNLTADKNWSSSRLIFFETHKDIFGWVSLKDCWEALKIEEFKKRIEFILSKLKRD